MSVVAPSRHVEQVSLVRPATCDGGLGQLDTLGLRLSRGLMEYFKGLSNAPAIVNSSSARLERTSREPRLASRTISLRGRTGTLVSLCIDRQQLMAVVDSFYGGDGVAQTGSDCLSPAESRFLERIVKAFCEVMGAAWRPIEELTANPTDDLFEHADVALQVFEISCEGWPSFTLECRYPLELLTLLPRRTPAGDVEAEFDGVVWEKSLSNNALNVTFPVRAVLAEPELPLSQLIRLRPGDVIPIRLPALMDLTVAGVPLAKGSIGDSDGRAAFRIERI